jgi:Tfp pilus assembly protein PilX
MVLLLCLIFMTALTLLGLATTSDTLLQKQLANNLRDAEFAKQTAHLSLQWVEQWISQLPATTVINCDQNCGGFYAKPAGSLDSAIEFQPFTTWQLQGFEAGLDPVTGERQNTFGANTIEPPMWLIEHLHHSPATVDSNTPANETPEKDWYRILVRSTGKSQNTVSVFESVIVRSQQNSDQTTASSAIKRVSWQELR